MKTFKLYKRTEWRESQQSSFVLFCFTIFFFPFFFFKNIEAVTTEVIGESQPSWSDIQTENFPIHILKSQSM